MVVVDSVRGLRAGEWSGGRRVPIDDAQILVDKHHGQGEKGGTDMFEVKLPHGVWKGKAKRGHVPQEKSGSVEAQAVKVADGKAMWWMQRAAMKRKRDPRASRSFTTIESARKHLPLATPLDPVLKQAWIWYLLPTKALHHRSPDLPPQSRAQNALPTFSPPTARPIFTLLPLRKRRQRSNQMIQSIFPALRNLA